MKLAQVSAEEYTVVLMQGSGTFGVESVFSSVIGDDEKVLICSNGAYGERMTQICDRNRISYAHYQQVYDKIPDAAEVARLLADNPSITHVSMVHSETTSGILNDIQSVGKVVREAGRTFSFFRPAGSVEKYGKRRKMALYFSYSRSSGLCPGLKRIRGRR